MKYPTITERSADELVGELLALSEVDRLTHLVEETGWVDELPGGAYPLESVEKASEEARVIWEDHVATLGRPIAKTDRERLEARMASVVHEALRDVTPRVLGDIGFWRYLALFPFRWYLAAREPEMQPQDYGGSSTDPLHPERRESKDPKYQLLLRTFLWGKAAYDPNAIDPYERATKVGAAGGAEIDVWHSHIVRVQLGHLGSIPHHFIDSICEAPVAHGRDDGRAVEKRLTRMKHNILLDVYESDGRQLVDAQKALALSALKKK